MISMNILTKENAMYTLYGDGVHDDYPAIQEMLDSGACEVVLPAPRKNYLISKTLIISSNCRLVLPRFAHIKLADGANCFMLQNKTVYKPERRTHPHLYKHEEHLGEAGIAMVDKYNFFVNDYSPDPEDTAKNIEICGGIWDCNNMGQNPNPQRNGIYEPYGFTGYGMLFYNVKDLTIRSLTMKDPTNFSITLDRVSYFTVRDINFDFNLGNPVPLNMDGVHVNGNCHYGTIDNLKGACYDDLVALNADEGSFGPITNINVSNISAENCHSAVRLLTVKNVVENIHISDVYGTYYQYAIGVTRFYKGDFEGYFDGITLDNLYISKADREPIRKIVNTVLPKWGTGSHFAPVWIQKDAIVKNIKISNLHRRELVNPVETVFVGANTVVDNMILENISTENHTGMPMPLLKNDGIIKHLYAECLHAVGDEVYAGDGTIEEQI